MEKQEIKLKQIGNNLIIVIDGKQMTKVVKEKEVRETIKTKVLLYNKRPSKTGKEYLQKFFDTKVAKKEELVAKAKGVKKSVKKEVKAEVKHSSSKKKLIDELSTIKKGELSNTALQAGIDKLKALQEKNRKVEKEAPKPQVAPTRRSGEY